MHRTNISRFIVTGIICLSFVYSIFVSDSVDAIPAFARKYSMSCTTCHAPFPRLKPYGNEFAGNGFEIENQDSPRYTMKSGDDRLELIRTFPLAARFDGFIKYQSETNKDVDFTAPYNLKILSGGRLGKNIAYYFYFFMSERGEVAGVEDAYIMFNNLFGQDFDIYLGQFQVSDPLFKRELRLTYEDYMIYKYKPEQSRISLTYDRGVMMTWGIENGPDVIVEILNGNGIGAADEFKTYDDDKFKTVAGRLSYDLNDNVRIGGFGYYGKENGISGPGDSLNTNKVTFYGPDMSLSTNKLELNLQYLVREDDNPEFEATLPDNKAKAKGGLAELIFWPDGDNSRWYLTGLYNQIKLDPADGSETVTYYETLSAHAGYMVQTNLRLIFETMYDIENEETRVMFGFVSGF